MNKGLLVEKLKAESKELYSNYETNVSVIRFALMKYRDLFPHASDYSILHSLEIIEFCDKLIGSKNLDKLNADDCYCILMASLLQYLGFGIRESDYECFAPEVLSEEALHKNDMRDNISANVAEFSVCLIKKISSIFEFPSKEHERAIISLVRVSERENNLEIDAYSDIELANNNSLHLTYLAAILRVADYVSELVNRNIELSYSMLSDYDNEDIIALVGRLAVTSLRFENGEIIIGLQGSDTVNELVNKFVKLLQELIDLSNKIIDERTEFEKIYKAVKIERIKSMDGNEISLNKEIEASWTDEDWECFHKLAEDERLFYLRYLSAEYGVTKRLKEFSEQKGTSLAALEFRVKSPRSLYNKLYLRAEKQSLLQLGDTIRYTAIFPEAEYTSFVKEMIASFENDGWRLCVLRNAWLQKEFPYNGINIKIKNEDGFIAEIQFHTQDSYDVKMSPEDHELYEKRRMYAPDTKEYKEILQKQLELYSKMEIPANIDTIASV